MSGKKVCGGQHIVTDHTHSHSLRYMDFPRGSSSWRHMMYAAGKKHRFVCECGKVGDWKSSMKKAGFAFDEHVRWANAASA